MSTTGRNRLYGDLAHWWPLLSPPAGYADEAPHWRNAIMSRLGPGRHALLDLGTGGGHHLSHLTADFDATAVDLSEDMLTNARRLNPGVTHHVGDMRTIRLPAQFDAVTIHDAIAYMTSEEDLLAAFRTARAHLRPGGVFVTVPDHDADTFESPYVHHETHLTGGVQATLIEYTADLDPTDTTIETTFLFILDQGNERRAEIDHHVTGLFPVATWARLLKEAGFIAEQVDFPVGDKGRDLYLWVAQTAG